MEYAVLGRTKLRVSIAGLGSGGHSRLGQTSGASFAESVRVVECALDLGVNVVDTAANYGTEPIVGQGIARRRGEVVLSTKTTVVRSLTDPALISAAELFDRLDASLTRLGTDYVDIYHLHGVTNDQLDHAVQELVPALLKAREQGKIRFIGITDRFAVDTRHTMLQRALASDVWDVVMVGFNLLNPSARHTIFPLTQQRGIGVLNMFAVRRALSRSDALREEIARAEAAGQIEPSTLDKGDPLGFLGDHAEAITDAAYRFCRHEPGVDVVLTGTGNVHHLTENIRSISKSSLPPRSLERLAQVFGRVDCISGE